MSADRRKAATGPASSLPPCFLFRAACATIIHRSSKQSVAAIGSKIADSLAPLTRHLFRDFGAWPSFLHRLHRITVVEEEIMNAVKIFCVLALLLALVGLPLRAQQPSGQSFSPSPDNAGAGDAVNGGSKDYPLGPGDVLELRVFGETQFDGPYSVDEDGFIRFPFIE